MSRKIALALAPALVVLAILVALRASGPPASAAGATAVSASLDHTCAVTAAGGAKCWGSNNFGQLGDGSTMPRTAPVDVSSLTSGVVAISAGEYHTCALLTSGGVKCWGGNYKGQLGDGSMLDSHTPVDVMTLSSGVTAIAAGGNHTCARTSTGGAKCWGDNADGQLGGPASDDCDPGPLVDPCSKTPQNVSGLTSGVAGIAAGRYHTCALTSGGGVKCWGHNFLGQVGNGSSPGYVTLPANVSGLSSGVASIDLGAFHTCAVTTGGAAKCWGTNVDGQLGDGTTTMRNTPVAVSGLDSGVTGISGGRYHSCASMAAGGVKCWGANGSGQLGDGTMDAHLTPTDVQGLSGVKASLATGWRHSCALPYSGALQCWGANGTGQVGSGAPADQLSPVAVTGLGAKELPTPTPTNTPTPPPPCPGDVTGDLVVTVTDIAEVVAHFGHSEAADPAKWAAHEDARRDLNGDGAITAGDIALVVAEYGRVCS
jgi:alpha-tubulin suppressor-like RCC1 family protein